jgi:hypothetical protein
VNYTALKQELVTDPLGLGYGALIAKGDHMGTAALLNAPDRPARRPIPAKAIKRYLMLKGRWAAVKGAAADGALPQVLRAAAGTVLDALEAFEDFDAGDPEVEAAMAAMIDALVAAGALAPEDKAAIMALGDARRSRAEELGLGPVRGGHVTEALGS